MGEDQVVIRLTEADASRYAALRRRMLDDAPWAFDASPEDDYALEPADIAALLEGGRDALLAVEDGSRRLVGAVGLNRSRHAKLAHRACLWGMYVAPAHRGRGHGRALVSGAIDLARSWPGVDSVSLSVSARSQEALRLYESLGFRAWGREPGLLAHAGRRYDEIHMLLEL